MKQMIKPVRGFTVLVWAKGSGAAKLPYNIFPTIASATGCR